LQKILLKFFVYLRIDKPSAVPAFPHMAAIIHGGGYDTFAHGDIYYTGRSGGRILTCRRGGVSPIAFTTNLAAAADAVSFLCRIGLLAMPDRGIGRNDPVLFSMGARTGGLKPTRLGSSRRH
jgi:hypothetical protein